MINDKINTLIAMCKDIDIDLNKIEQFIFENKLTSEEITISATELAYDCMLEIELSNYQENNPTADKLISSNFIDLFDLFLKHGLMPNYTYNKNATEQRNIMDAMLGIDNGDVAPIIMRKLLEIGGNPNLKLEEGTLFRLIDFDIIFDVTELDNKRLFDIEFKLWILLMGYGGYATQGTEPVDMKQGYSFEIFKNFENFYYNIEFLEKDWIMHIFDIETNDEVATL